MSEKWRALAEIVKLNDYIYGIDEQGKVNLFVINGSEKAMLLDTGSGLLHLKELIKELCGDKSVITVNTHAHLDHNLGNSQFSAVHVGRRDVPASYLTEDEIKGDDSTAYMADGVDPELLADWRPGSSETVRPLSEGDVISLGDLSLEVIELPSHTVGSIALFERKQGWLFTGDVILPWAGWGWLPQSASVREYYESVSKLISIQNKVTHLYSSHGKEDTRVDGLSRFELPVRALEIYRDGLTKILAGNYVSKPFVYDGLLEGKRVGDIPKEEIDFEIGGVIIDPRRIER